VIETLIGINSACWQLRPTYDEETTPDASAHEYTKMSSLGSLKFLFWGVQGQGNLGDYVAMVIEILPRKSLPAVRWKLQQINEDVVWTSTLMKRFPTTLTLIPGAKHCPLASGMKLKIETGVESETEVAETPQPKANRPPLAIPMSALKEKMKQFPKHDATSTSVYTSFAFKIARILHQLSCTWWLYDKQHSTYTWSTCQRRGISSLKT